ILTSETEPAEPEEMLRRPGEPATAPQPVVAPPPVTPPPPPVQPTVPLQPPPAAATPPKPPRKRRSPALYIAIGFAVGAVIIGIVLLLTSGGGGGNGGPSTTGTSAQATPDCTTEFFQGSLGERVLGPCQNAMRGNDVKQLQAKLNQVLDGVRVL